MKWLYIIIMCYIKNNIIIKSKKNVWNSLIYYCNIIPFIYNCLNSLYNILKMIT